jgi:hypothetical protein
MTDKIGILAYGSLIDDPGDEIRQATVCTLIEGIVTPFRIEFARTSKKRKGAPSLVPVDAGGAHVPARIFVLNVDEAEAANRLYRREINAIGKGVVYTPRRNPGKDDVVVERISAFAEVDTVLYTRIGANIENLTAKRLAAHAIQSAKNLKDDRDGITYLMRAKRNGITTPLSAAYEQEVLRATGTGTLEEALCVIHDQN